MSRHLTPAEIVDLMERGDGEQSTAHVAVCAECRAALEETRAVVEGLAHDPVPEPSPLYWTHAAERVRAAIAAEPQTASLGYGRRVAWAAGGLAIAAMVAWLIVRPSSPTLVTDPATASAPAIADDVADLQLLDEEDSWTLVSALGAELDMETAAGSSLLATQNASDRALLVLNDDERVELGALLTNELRRSKS
jgi:hypothetical protein